jgi:ATP-binding cassette subfamily B multidrug efflux pump
MKSLLRLRPYFFRYRWTLLFGFLTVITSNIFSVIQPHLLGKAIDDLKRGVDTHTVVVSDLIWYAGLIVAFSLIAGICSYLTRQTIIVVSRHIEFDLRNDLLVHLQALPHSYFQHTSTGDLMAHATNDISAVRNVVGPGVMYPSDTIMTFIMVLTMMMLKDWQLTLYALVPLPLVSIVVYQLGKLVNKKFTERQEQFSLLTAHAQESLSGIRVVKAYVREAYEAGRFRSLSWDYLRKNLVLALVQSIMWPLMFLLVGVSMIITMYLGGLRVIEGQMTVGTLSAFIAYLVMLIWPVIAFGWVMNMLQQGAASMGRLATIFDTVPEIRDSETTDSSITSIIGRIEFRDVSFTHRGAARPALQNIDLTVEPGRTLAIVGYTGSGKSTLVGLIPRLSDPSTGTILLDGLDIRSIPLSVLREHVGFVPQETFLFSDTIAENILYGAQDRGEENLKMAADISQISRDVDDFPNAYETVLGERGITLSGGQKQRTSIARAVARHPRILILDDALSAVDTDTEEQILHRLRTYMKDRTSIIISHRISTVKDADLIVVLNDGVIAERGTHDTLVAHGGIYAELHRKQLLEEQLERM